MSAAIKVKCFNGKTYDVDVATATDSVADLQSQIAKLSDIAAERQTLLFKGKVLEPSAPVSDYPIESGVTISVVRRVGKAVPPAASKPKAKTAAAPAAVTSSAADAGCAEDDAAVAPATMPMPGIAGLGGIPGLGADAGGAGGQMQAMEAMMRQLGMGGAGGAGMGGMGGMGGQGGLGGMPGMEALAGAGGMESLMSQMPAMMKGLMQSDALKDYLNDPSKQEASRDAIISNPMLKQWLESDPEFSKVVNDPEQWKKSMEAAKSLFGAEDLSGGDSATDSRGLDDGLTKPSAAAIAPPGLNIAKLSESYGHALGQSLVNSGLGLDPELVIKGFKTACSGGPFPMALPEYERAMAQLQNLAAEFLQQANLKDANLFFEEVKEDDQMVVLEEGKIAYERGDVEPDADQPVALGDSTVLVIITARLLDGRHFFTCPAADDAGETVHPLTLPLDTAPPALTTGIKGMKETESRLLYVHPTAAEGMAEMFGDLLPPNALLIFDLQLVSANAPEEEVAAVREAAEAAAVR
jgi:FKBP-type peptidyl-prolyl cis-trans isomerase